MVAAAGGLAVRAVLEETTVRVPASCSIWQQNIDRQTGSTFTSQGKFSQDISVLYVFYLVLMGRRKGNSLLKSKSQKTQTATWFP